MVQPVELEAHAPWVDFKTVGFEFVFLHFRMPCGDTRFPVFIGLRQMKFFWSFYSVSFAP